jgi:hypothetical protein
VNAGEALEKVGENIGEQAAEAFSDQQKSQ